MKVSRKRITLAEAQEHFTYDPDTGVLNWKSRAGSGREVARWNERYAGKEAGCINKQGYRRVQVLGLRVQVHLIAWLFSHGVWPDHEVDHIDRCKTHNWAGNLREASRTENARNASLSKRNTSGRKGVHWHSRNKRWIARIQVDGVSHSLGSFRDKEAASSAYQAAAQKLFGAFATDGAAS